MRFDVLTLFPEIFSGYMTQSLLKLAIDRSLVSIHLHNLRDWSRDKHKCVDDRPFGGGPGMVIKPEPVVEAVEALLDSVGLDSVGLDPVGLDPVGLAPEGLDSVGLDPVGPIPVGQGQVGESQSSEIQDADLVGADLVGADLDAGGVLGGASGHVVLLTPQGRQLDQKLVEELSGHKRLLLLCGRYEGFDQRVSDLLRPDEISIGDFVLNGGEVAAMALIDTVIRLVPGVLGDETSNRYDSFSTAERILEHAQYTRPREYRGLKVPEVLLSGDHTAIAQWRDKNSLQRTRERRSDLLSSDFHNSDDQK